MKKNLGHLGVGETGRIEHLSDNIQLKKRLSEMGLTGGTEITKISVAPLGDPIQYSIRGYRIALRKSEVAQIRVR